MTINHGLNHRRIFRNYAFGLVAAGAYCFLPVQAAPITLNLKDADINALVEHVGAGPARTSSWTLESRAKVTIISAKPMDEKVNSMQKCSWR